MVPVGDRAIAVVGRQVGPKPLFLRRARGAAALPTDLTAKARRALGFEPRSHEETLADAVAWQLDELGDRVRRDRRPERLALGMLALAGRTARRAAVGLGLE